MRASADTKHQIMVAAEKVMSQKGLKDSTISEIATLANINDSVIYHYFKNKEDLLFSIEGDHLQKVTKMLKEQLVGIPEVMSRLSKMVWFHLNYNLSNRDYSKLLVFECRSNINFYKHQAYNLIRRYAKIMLDILDDGVREGVFRDDVDTYLMRDLIIGATDWITIRRIVQDDFSDIMPEVERFMALVRIMIKAPSPGVPAKNDKHARILAAAEKAFSQRGYSAATIAEIARLAGVAEGTIYEYFTNKQDLLMSIPKARFAEHIDKLKELFVIKSTVRKLRRFVHYHFLLYLTQPDFLRVFLLNIQLNPDFYRSESFAMFQQYTAIVDRILEEGKGNRCLREEVESEMFKAFLFGGFSHVTLRWYILGQETDQDKMAEINSIVTLLTDAVVSPEEGAAA